MQQDHVTIGLDPDGFNIGLRRGSMTRLYASGLGGKTALEAVPKLMEILSLETARERDAALAKMIAARDGRGDTGEP